ncbi:SRPBCC family protein [Pseudonocardia broussonetiae]|uniref:SRPBCC family protein n=1 Tax=Pseudonocardia broussonetiae TaxID=2736640 RepID=A0A6M6JS31_9PSEU|nr:SRPBCC family protein [Pseudonocardia broussonetiae]QJY49827.1 SRPBCC family protein [Pseudonocardia broussonetiae]
MPRAYASAVIAASADEVWGIVRDFNGLASWMPAIAASALDTDGSAAEAGAVRRLTLGDGGTVVERLLALDDHVRSQTYEILESPFPVRRYVATVRVAPVTDTGRAFVEWWTDFDADAADEPELVKLFADGVFGAGMAAIQQRYSA